MGCQSLDDIYELYLLGVLSAEESAEVSAHVRRGCPYCLDRLRESAQVVSLVALNTLPAPPSARHKAALLERVKRPKGAH